MQTDALIISKLSFRAAGNWDSCCHSLVALTPATAGTIHKYRLYSAGRTDNYTSASITGIVGVSSSSISSGFYRADVLSAVYSSCA